MRIIPATHVHAKRSAEKDCLRMATRRRTRSVKKVSSADQRVTLVDEPSTFETPLQLDSRLRRSNSETSTISNQSQPRARAAQFSPRATDTILSDEDEECHESHRNHFYTHFIATYIIGSKALVQNPSRGRLGEPITVETNNCCKREYSFTKMLFGIFWVIYMILVWWKVLVFLKEYYLSGNSPIPEIREKEEIARYLIFISYFALDAVYPLAFLLLMNHHSSDLLERTEKVLLSECGESAYKNAQDKTGEYYQKGDYVLILLNLYTYHRSFSRNCVYSLCVC